LKKSVSVCLAALIVVALPVSAHAEINERTIRISSGINPEHPVGDGIRSLEACLAERSDGKMELQAFWASALGSDLEQTQSLRSGIQEMTITSTSPLVGILGALGSFDMPFLFNSAEEADAILDGEFGDYINEQLEAVGVVNLAYWENGFRNLTNSKGPVAKWEDLQGMRIRVMQNNIFLDTFENMGANAMPMAFGEVFSALETGTIDAQENPYVTIDTSHFDEVQGYLSITNHAYTPYLALFSKPIFDSYTAEEQQILRDCTIAARDVQRAAARALSTQSLQNLEDRGMAVNELQPDERARMQEKAQVIYERHAAEIGPEVLARLQSALDALRATK
jgi:tripartite ATP-independent transporter DctP family solute receptor